MRRIGVVTGLALEAQALVGSLGADGETLQGMGEEAASAADRLLARGATGLTSMGVCGALRQELRCGDVVLAREGVDRDGRPWLADWGWSERIATALRTRGIDSTIGRLVTTAAPVLAPADKALLGTTWQAVAVDMESAHVARRAAASSTPVVAVRVVIDALSRPVPPALADLGTAGGPSALVRSPGALRALPGFARDLWRALRVLRRVVPLVVAAGPAILQQ